MQARDNGRRGQGEERTAGGVDSKEDNWRSGQLQGWMLKKGQYLHLKGSLFNKIKRLSLIAIVNKLIYCSRIVGRQQEGGHPEEVELRTRKGIKKRGDEDEETNDPHK